MLSSIDIIVTNVAVWFTKTEGKKEIMDKLLQNSKKFCQQREFDKKYKIRSTPKQYKIIDKHFSFTFSYETAFSLIIGFGKKADRKQMNDILNDWIENIYSSNMEELIEALFYYEIRAGINNIDPFQKLTNDTWRNYFNDSFRIRRLEIWQPPSKSVRQGFFFIRTKDKLSVNAIRSNIFDRIPKDILLSFGAESNEELEGFFKKLK